MALSLTLGGVQPSYAATGTLSPGQSIQTAINGAAAGDTIQLNEGVYNEKDITIPAGKNGLKIQRKVRRDCGDEEAVIIDAFVGGAAGEGFVVQSTGVRIFCLTVRQSTTGFDIQADGATLDHVEALRSSDTSVKIAGVDGVSIKHPETIQGANGGVIATAVSDNLTISETTSRDHNGPCFDITGDKLTMSDSNADTCNGIGVNVVGNTAKISDTDVQNTNLDRTSVAGQQMRLTKNTAEGTGAGGGAGFSINCSVSCGSATLDDNIARHANGGNLGFFVVATASGFTVNSNEAELNSGGGFRLDTTNATITSNSATRNGRAASADQVGFWINGDGKTFSSNTAKENVDDGIRVTGSNNTLSRNTADGNLVHRIGVDSGTNNSLQRNSVQKNDAEGIELKTGVTVLANRNN
jgi:parallel beta-helix repeat protein